MDWRACWDTTDDLSSLFREEESFDSAWRAAVGELEGRVAMAVVVDEEAPFASGIRGLDITLEDEPPRSLREVLSDRRSPLVPLLLSFVLCALSTTAFSEVIPLLAFAREGLGLDVLKVGLIQSIASLTALLGSHRIKLTPPTAYEIALLVCALFAYPTPAVVASYAPRWYLLVIPSSIAALAAEVMMGALHRMLAKAAPGDVAAHELLPVVR